MSHERCAICSRDPKRMNSAAAECSHVDCPHRRRAWSERPAPAPRAPRTPFSARDYDPRPLSGEPGVDET